MLKIILTLTAIFLCTTTHAEQINLHWLNADGSTYSESTCTVNGDLIIPSTPPTKYGYTFIGWKLGDYIPIEYLESTGKQWVDTGIAITNATLYTEIMPMRTFIKNGIIGYNYNNGAHRLSLGGNSYGDITFGYGDSSSSYQYINFLELGKKTAIKIQYLKDIVYLSADDVILSTAHGTRSDPINIFVNGVNALSNTTGLNGRFFSAKIWNNDTGVLVRDFIPVLDMNGTPCMFDKVEQKFYYNAGTDDFIAGPVIGE